MINDFNRRWCVGVKTNLNITRGTTQKSFMYIIVRKSYNFIVNTLARPAPVVTRGQGGWGWLICLSECASLSAPIWDCNDPPDLDWWTLAATQTSDGIISTDCNCRFVCWLEAGWNSPQSCWQGRLSLPSARTDIRPPQRSALLARKNYRIVFIKKKKEIPACFISS